MALEAHAPIVPVAMINTYEIQPPGKLRPQLMRVGIRIGKPLDFSRYEGLEDDRFVLRSVTDEVMYELMTLSGQEYVDMYATRAKELISQGEQADAASSLS
jgi:1-acyl-sn-glycerol-3-phosphate acyltransferase